jgi:hypothetical protein
VSEVTCYASLLEVVSFSVVETFWFEHPHEARNSARRWSNSPILIGESSSINSQAMLDGEDVEDVMQSSSWHTWSEDGGRSLL